MKSVIGMMLLVNLLSVIIYAQSGKNLSPQISITIDDIDINSNDTPKFTLDQRNLAILDALRQHGNLKAALFVCGMRVDNEQGRKHLLEWGKAKHIIANHSYSHFSYPGVEFDKFSQDILRGEKVISDLKHFRKLFRFPYLKEGNTLEKRDKIRSFLKENGYRMGYVTIDTSEWAIDARLRKRLNKEPNADLTNYRDFYLEHIWERAVFYDDLAKKVTGKPVKHTLLIHHNLIAALFLGDLLDMFKKKGWKLINAEKAFKDPVFNLYPDMVPANDESNNEVFRPIDPKTQIGHVHLKVANIERALRFYCGVLGFEITQRLGASAAFIAAGGYHHHIALNTWESLGGSPSPFGTTGLYHLAILYPNRAVLADALCRLIRAEISLEGVSDHGVSESLYLRNPDDNGVELDRDRPPEQWTRTADGKLAMDTRQFDLRSLLNETTAGSQIEKPPRPESEPRDL